MSFLDKGETAIAEYKVAIKFDPEGVQAYMGLGYIHLEQRDLDIAVEAFKRALEIEPDHVGAHLGLADALFFLSDYESCASIIRGL